VYNRVFSPSEILQLYKLGNDTVNASQTSMLSTGLVGLWSLDGPDKAGTMVYDRSGSGNGGTIVGASIKVAGKLWQALNFNGTTNRITIPDSASLRSPTKFSIGAWVNMKSNAGTQLILWHGLGGSTWGSYFLSYGGTECAENLGKFFSGFVLAVVRVIQHMF